MAGEAGSQNTTIKVQKPQNTPSSSETKPSSSSSKPAADVKKGQNPKKKDKKDKQADDGSSSSGAPLAPTHLPGMWFSGM